MNRDEVLRMAQEANRYANSQTEDRFDWQLIRDERFADLISAAEREACAKESQRQPLTDEEIGAAYRQHEEAQWLVASAWSFEAGVRWAEKSHGITGEQK